MFNWSIVQTGVQKAPNVSVSVSKNNEGNIQNKIQIFLSTTICLKLYVPGDI